MIKTRDGVINKMLKYGFTRWRDSIITDNKISSEKTKLLQKIFFKRLNYLSQAFLKWRVYQ